MSEQTKTRPLLSPVTDQVTIAKGTQVLLIDEPSDEGKIAVKKQSGTREVRIREIVRLGNGVPVACWGEKRARKGVVVDERVAQQLGAVLRQAA